MAAGNGRSPVVREATTEENGRTINLIGMGEDEFDALMAESQLAQLQERIAELEFAAEDSGWDRLDDSGTDLDPSSTLLRRVIRDAQTMYLANPLINHAIDTMAVYVFGQGVSISGEGVANDRVQTFITDRKNAKTLFGQQALLSNDRALTYEGSRFFALFGKPGECTQVRKIPTAQIVVDGDIIRDPEDSGSTWFYCRVRTIKGKSGAPERKVTYYPDIDYVHLMEEGQSKPTTWGEGDMAGPIEWDTPVVYVRDGGLDGSKFGFPTIYPALTWARAVSRDLSDYATVKRALARFAWKILAKTRAGARSIRERMETTVTSTDPRERNPAPATGSAFVAVEGNDIQPLRTAGAAPNPEEGRRLGLMVAAGAGVPETILFGNADAGNLATAKTLDRPTELMMAARQSIWQDALTQIVAYDLTRGSKDGIVPAEEEDPDAPPVEPIGVDGDPNAAILDPSGVAITNPPAMRPVELTPNVEFTDILEDDVEARVGAIIAAATLGANGQRADTMPDDLLTRLLLTALGVDDVDEIVREMFPPGVDIPDASGGLPGDIPADDSTAYGPPAFAEALDAFTERLTAGGGGYPGTRGTGRRTRRRRTAAASTAS